MSPELSDLVVYCRSVPFSGFEAASQRPPSEMSSFSENEALKHIKDSGETRRVVFKHTNTWSIYVVSWDICYYLYLYIP